MREKWMSQVRKSFSMVLFHLGLCVEQMDDAYPNWRRPISLPISVGDTPTDPGIKGESRVGEIIVREISTRNML